MTSVVQTMGHEDQIRGQRTGSLIGAVFGLIYVLVNAGPLPPAAGLTLRIIGAAAFAAVLVALLRGRQAHTHDRGVAVTDSPSGNEGFGRAYWLVVAAEVVALAAGLAVLNGPLDAPQAAVGWVSFVVGVHFFALAVVFGEPLFHRIGAAITACGIAGLALSAAGASDAPIAVVSGILPGAILLAFAWRGARTAQQPTPSAG